MIISPGFSVGHFTDTERETGATVFLMEKRSPCSYVVCGSAPALREVTVLDMSMRPDIDALIFTGGSAFGLGAANGVMRWLAERKKGLGVGKAIIPIVPAASIFDNGMAYHNTYPTEKEAYLACEAASQNKTLRGRVGVGTGATVGTHSKKFSAMPGGFGSAWQQEDNGLFIAAFAVVNPFGDVLENGKIIAGPRHPDGSFVNVTEHTHAYVTSALGDLANTTLVAVFTNAQLQKRELTALGKMCAAGIARAISPSFTIFDGDVVFAISVGDHKADLISLGSIGAKLTQQAIIDAIKL